MYNGKVKRVGGHLTPVSALFAQYAGRENTHFKRVGDILRLKTMWGELVGEQIAKFSSPYRIKDGVLMVSVSDPIWIAELPYIKDALVAKIAAIMADIDDVRFTLPKTKPKTKSVSRARRKLSDIELAEVERLADTIKDDKIRAAYRRALMACKQATPSSAQQTP
jgi:hypothetical protein